MVSVFIVLVGGTLVVCRVRRLTCSSGCCIRAGGGLLVVYPALVLARLLWYSAPG
jgi:hypothetical protein